MTDLDSVLGRAEQLLRQLENVLPPAPAEPDWAAVAFRWRRRQQRGFIQAVRHPHDIRLSDLVGIDRQKQELERNIRQFVRGLPANNVLLWGSRGTGKSSLIKALLGEYAPLGLRLIEVEKQQLEDLPDIVDLIHDRPERFVIFSDDLSFESDDGSYKALKSLLDGSVAATPHNVLVCATSNRRHLMPEYMRENLEAHRVDDEIHPGESVEEKVSLSDRFGLWLSFYPFRQDEYLAIVFHWLEVLGVDPPDTAEARAEALKWALARGSRSGRTARQFALDWAGRTLVRGT